MKNFVLKKKNKNKKIVKLNFKEEGYLFKPNIKNPNLIKITNLSLLSEKFSSPILKKKIDASFRKLTQTVYIVLNDDEDADSGDIAIALNELTKEKNILIHKYKNYIEKSEYEKQFKRLKLLEVELKEKLMYIMNREEELENVRGR